AIDDQLRAASAEANARLRRAGRRYPLRYTDDQPAPAWLTAALQRHAVAMFTGQARTCGHLPATPGMVCAFAWAPGLLVCPACPELATPTGAEDMTCDRCRRPVGDPLWVAIAQFGPLLFGYGLCSDCQYTPE